MTLVISTGSFQWVFQPWKTVLPWPGGSRSVPSRSSWGVDEATSRVPPQKIMATAYWKCGFLQSNHQWFGLREHLKPIVFSPPNPQVSCNSSGQEMALLEEHMKSWDGNTRLPFFVTGKPGPHPIRDIFPGALFGGSMMFRMGPGKHGTSSLVRKFWWLWQTKPSHLFWGVLPVLPILLVKSLTHVKPMINLVFKSCFSYIPLCWETIPFLRPNGLTPICALPDTLTS